MEIESLLFSLFCPLLLSETKKVSWKWRLKVKGEVAMRAIPIEKQRKSPENGDWKYSIVSMRASHTPVETKKVSWKWRLKDEIRNCWIRPSNVGNKESLLKMEIERECGESKVYSSWSWNKESLLKMEIERIARVSTVMLNFLETKKVSWKWRLKEL